MIKRCVNLFVGALALYTSVASAGLIVAPNANTSVEGNDLTILVDAAFDFTMQWVFDDSQLAAIPVGSTITGIGFRADSTTSGTTPALSFPQWNLQVSTSLNAPGSLSATFANNIGPDVVLVRSGPLNLASGFFDTTGTPRPFAEIPFTTGYVYTGGDILLTLREQVPAGPFVFLDALTLPNSVTDSVGNGSFTATVGTAHFFNVPVTAFVFTEPRAAVPEPATLALLGMGLAGIAGSRRRKLN